MKFDFVPKMITAKTGTNYYGICLVLKQDGVVVRESKILMYITEEQYNELTRSK